MSSLEPAAVLGGRYRVLRPIGRGGMGAVYEAIDLRLSHSVAVKAMTAEGEEANRAFEREARLLASLRHQTLPVVSDYFIEAGARYLVMQYIEGENLASLFKRTGPQPHEDVVSWGVAILRALIYLHGHQPPIVHRDIKPSNITLTPRGDVVLLDFGLAKGSPAHQTRIDRDEPSIYGFTPGYAPPEQLAATGTDARSDLYALAATLYHLACGAPPPGAGDRMQAIASGRPDLLSIDERTPLPSRLAAVLRRALALEPPARFQSAVEMLESLDVTAPLRFVEPVPAPAGRSRRLDAAAPSEAEVGREIDLLVQVRFADSPRLGLEDWPTRRRPAQIEQASESVAVEHPVHPATGQKLPARLRIKLVAPDFDVRGACEQLIEVPPDEYSRRLAFLMAPRHLGYCRVNVEVYSAADAVFLGSLAVEADALASVDAVAERQVAALALGVTGVAEDASAPRGRDTTPGGLSGDPVTAPPLLSRRDDLARKRAAEIERQLAAARAAIEAGDLEAACTSCERALVVDPDHAGALALHDLIRHATTQGPMPKAMPAPTAMPRAMPAPPKAPMRDDSPTNMAMRPDEDTLRELQARERLRAESAARQSAESDFHMESHQREAEDARRRAEAQRRAIPVEDEERTLATAASERSVVSVSASGPDEISVSAEALPSPAARRVPQWIYGAASAAMIVFAVIVFRSTGAIDTSAPPPTANVPPTVEPRLQTPAPSATAPPPAVTAPDPAPVPADPPPAAVRPPAAVPPPAAGSSAPAPPVSVPVPRPPAPGPTPPIDRYITVTSTNVPDVRLQLLDIARAPGVARLRLRIVNNASSAVDASVAMADTQLAAAANRYRIASARPSAGARDAANLPAGGAIEYVVEFRVPDAIGGPCELILVPANPRAAAFPPIPCTLTLR